MSVNRNQMKELLKALDVSVTKMAEELGRTRQSITQTYQKDKLPPSFIRDIKESFPNVSSDWLVSWEGEIFTQPKRVIEIKNGENADSVIIKHLEKIEKENYQLKVEIEKLKSEVKKLEETKKVLIMALKKLE